VGWDAVRRRIGGLCDGQWVGEVDVGIGIPGSIGGAEECGGVAIVPVGQLRLGVVGGLETHRRASVEGQSEGHLVEDGRSHEGSHFEGG
jgi:hypothetical protein